MNKCMRVLFLATVLCVVVQTSSLSLAGTKDQSIPKMLRSTGEGLEEAYELIENKKLDKAIAMLNRMRKKVSETFPDIHYIQRTLGYIYIEKNQYSKAISYLNAALEKPVFPSEIHESTTIDLAQLYFANNQHSKVVDLLAPLIKVNGKSFQGSRIMGASLIALGRFREAIAYLEDSLKRSNPIERSLGLTLVNAYSRVKKYKSAALLIERMLKLYPQDKELWRQLAQMLYLNNQYIQAAARYYVAYEKKLVTSKEDIFFLAQLQAEAGTPVLGINVLKESLSAGSFKASSSVYELLARLSTQAQNHIDAARYFELKYSSSNSNLSDLVMASQLYLYADKFKDAERTAHTVLAKANGSDKTKSRQRTIAQAQQILKQIKQIREVEQLEHKYFQ